MSGGSPPPGRSPLLAAASTVGEVGPDLNRPNE